MGALSLLTRALVLPNRTSARGVRFVAGWEGLRLHPYNDAANNATIGYGHLLHFGPVTAADRQRWRSFDHLAALELLARDLGGVELAILRGVSPAISRPARFDAIASLVFNVGPDVLSSRHTLGRCLNRRDRDGVADAILLYDHAGGSRLPGLTARRQAERRLWLAGDYGFAP